MKENMVSTKQRNSNNCHVYICVDIHIYQFVKLKFSSVSTKTAYMVVSGIPI